MVLEVCEVRLLLDPEFPVLRVMSVATANVHRHSLGITEVAGPSRGMELKGLDWGLPKCLCDRWRDRSALEVNGGQIMQATLDHTSPA